MSNVPDDWDNYYKTCSAGHRYHASEGGCGACDELLPCICCECSWVTESDEDGPYVVCSVCGSMPGEIDEDDPG